MAFNISDEVYQRMLCRLRTEHLISSQHKAYEDTMQYFDEQDWEDTYRSFTTQYKLDSAALSVNDQERALVLLSQSVELLDDMHHTPYISDARKNYVRGCEILQEAHRLDPHNLDIKRMLISTTRTIPETLAYLLHHEKGFDGEKCIYQQAQDHYFELEKKYNSYKENVRVAELHDKSYSPLRYLAFAPYWRWLAMIAYLAYLTGRYRLAQNYAEKLLQEDPYDHAQIRSLLALILAKLEDYAAFESLCESWKHAEQSISLPMDARLQLAQLSLCLKSKQKSRATAIFEQLLIHYPKAEIAFLEQLELPRPLFAFATQQSGSIAELEYAISDALPILEEGFDDLAYKGFVGKFLLLTLAELRPSIHNAVQIELQAAQGMIKFEKLQQLQDEMSNNEAFIELLDEFMEDYDFEDREDLGALLITGSSNNDFSNQKPPSIDAFEVSEEHRALYEFCKIFLIDEQDDMHSIFNSRREFSFDPKNMFFPPTIAADTSPAIALAYSNDPEGTNLYHGEIDASQNPSLPLQDMWKEHIDLCVLQQAHTMPSLSNQAYQELTLHISQNIDSYCQYEMQQAHMHFIRAVEAYNAYAALFLNYDLLSWRAYVERAGEQLYLATEKLEKLNAYKLDTTLVHAFILKPMFMRECNPVDILIDAEKQYLDYDASPFANSEEIELELTRHESYVKNCYKDLIDEMPKDEYQQIYRINISERARFHAGCARLYLQNANIGLAVTHARLAIAFDPQDKALARATLACAYTRLEDIHAFNELEQSWMSDRSAAPWFIACRAVLQYRKQDVRGAQRTIRMLMRLYPALCYCLSRAYFLAPVAPLRLQANPETLLQCIQASFELRTIIIDMPEFISWISDVPGFEETVELYAQEHDLPL